MSSDARNNTGSGWLFVGVRARSWHLPSATATRQPAESSGKPSPEAYKQAHCFADIWEAYSKVIAQHQLIQSDSETNTNSIERFNCTLRNGCPDWSGRPSPFPKRMRCTGLFSLSSFMTTTIQKLPLSQYRAFISGEILKNDSLASESTFRAKTMLHCPNRFT